VLAVFARHYKPLRLPRVGTCAGLAQSSGVPAPAFRIAAIVVACLWFKLTILAYCVGALYYRFRR